MTSPARVVVLGAGGFIGARVTAALQASGWAHPVIATRRPAPALAPAPAPDVIEHVQVDATDAAALAHALQGASGVVNCIAGDAATIVANAQALRTAAGQCASGPRVVYLSSMAVYGAASGRVTESSPLNAGRDPYGNAKIRAEALVAAYPRTVILRPGIVFGPRSDWWSVQIARLLMQGRLGDLGPAGTGTCNLLYVEDMADATLRALRHADIDGRCFNLAMAGPPSWNGYFSLYARALGLPPPRRIGALRLALELRVRGPAIKLQELAARFSGLPGPSAPPIRPWLIELTRRAIVLDAAAAEQTLQLRWTEPQSALAATAAWFHGLQRG
jgi:nucleoside-diphosphate-sugar epimerase